MQKKPITYKEAGVDIEAMDAVKKHLKTVAGRTYTEAVLSGVGGFGGLFRLAAANYRDPVLVSSADGIGTKVMIAHAAKQYQNLGHDLVNHCVNDIGAMGAVPLFFLDYLAFGSFSPTVMTEIASGLAEACHENGCVLLGGETAEMPDLYRTGDFDVAGFIVGIVDRPEIIDGSRIQTGDALVGIFSKGLHTNGYSLVRRLYFSDGWERLREEHPALKQTLAELFLQPHISYLPLLTALRQQTITVKGIAHITGGGIGGNLCRILPAGRAAVIDWGSWDVPPLFSFIQEEGAVALEEMRRVFNMGIGLVLAVEPDQADRVIEVARGCTPGARLIGRVTEGSGEVIYDPSA